MSIGYQALGVPFRLSSESMGQPSYADAIARGLRNAGLSMDVAAKPSQLAEQLLASKLANHINSTRAKYAEPREQESLRGMGLANDIAAIRAKYAEPKELSNLNGMDLSNQINAIRAKYAEQQELADLKNKQNNLDLSPLRQKLLQSKLDTEDLNRGILSQKMSQEQNGPPMTNAMKSLLQRKILMIPQVQKQIEDIISAPSPYNISGFKPDQQGKHNALVSTALDTLIKAQGWNSTDKSIEKALSILDRHTFESDEGYRNRLKEYSKELGRDLSTSQDALTPMNSRKKRLKYNLGTGRLE